MLSRKTEQLLTDQSQFTIIYPYNSMNQSESLLRRSYLGRYPTVRTRRPSIVWSVAIRIKAAYKTTNQKAKQIHLCPACSEAREGGKRQRAKSKWKWKAKLLLWLFTFCAKVKQILSVPWAHVGSYIKLHANGRVRNNVGSCCVCVGDGVQTDARTPINVGPSSASCEGYNL